MEYPNHFKYGSPDFIEFIKNLSSNFNRRKGCLICFRGGDISGHVKAAQYIAFEILYRLIKIKSSKVVTKYIGETEKNLDRLFEKTDLRKVVLFFDEADALFNSGNDQFTTELFQIIRKSIDKSRRMVLLSIMNNAQIPKSLVGEIDTIIEFRELTK